VVLGLDYDGAIDIWSLGAVASELFSGEVLFENDSIQAMLGFIHKIFYLNITQIVYFCSEDSVYLWFFPSSYDQRWK